jgi:hypothetical protein
MSEIKEFNGFNCSIIPNDWDNYLVQYTTEKDRFKKCFDNLYLQKKNEYLGGNNEEPANDRCWNKIKGTYEFFQFLFSDTENRMNLLVATLNAATPYESETFDASTYYKYIEVYNQMIDTSKKLILMLNTRCTIMGVENNIGVDKQTIYPTDGITNPKTSTCVGVYMKQMDNGSEFRGKVSDDRIVYNNSVPGDGRINIS